MNQTEEREAQIEIIEAAKMIFTMYQSEDPLNKKDSLIYETVFKTAKDEDTEAILLVFYALIKSNFKPQEIQSMKEWIKEIIFNELIEDLLKHHVKDIEEAKKELHNLREAEKPQQKINKGE